MAHYYVVGGEYKDTHFRETIGGDEELGQTRLADG
jgi:hypothetical protein